jgi:hypothetical protein
VVVDFTGGRLINNEVQAGGLRKTAASLRVSHPDVATRAAARSADGVSVHVLKGNGQLRIEIGFAVRRIKYLSYAVVTGDRLAIDLWKSAPPSKVAEVRKGAHSCLVLDSWQVRPGVISVTGSERNIFENTFQVVVRGADGSVLGRHTGVHGPGKWSTQVHYRASRRQPGTLEAVAFSPKDGALECIAQVTRDAASLVSEAKGRRLQARGKDDGTGSIQRRTPRVIAARASNITSPSAAVARMYHGQGPSRLSSEEWTGL